MGTVHLLKNILISLHSKSFPSGFILIFFVLAEIAKAKSTVTESFKVKSNIFGYKSIILEPCPSIEHFSSLITG